MAAKKPAKPEQARTPQPWQVEGFKLKPEQARTPQSWATVEQSEPAAPAADE